MNIYLKISQVTFQYLLYLSNIIILHAVLPLNNCTCTLIPFSRINIRKFYPTVIGKCYWNALPVYIRDLTKNDFIIIVFIGPLVQMWRAEPFNSLKP